jgi:hypothetical protein
MSSELARLFVVGLEDVKGAPDDVTAGSLLPEFEDLGG